jgi:porphobilinogen deaminase
MSFNDQEILDLIMPLMHTETNACVRAERAFNAYLEGGCQVPIAGFATLENQTLSLEGRVGSADGQTLLRSNVQGAAEDAEKLRCATCSKSTSTRCWRITQSTLSRLNAFINTRPIDRAQALTQCLANRVLRSLIYLY